MKKQIKKNKKKKEPFIKKKKDNGNKINELNILFLNSFSLNILPKFLFIFF